MTLSPQIVEDAARRLAGVAHHTPALTCSAIDRVAGARVFLKCENLQRVGAFKFRGAFNAISRLSDAECARGVVTHSSGNHAQGVALAAQLCGTTATVVMPHDAPPNKRAATQGYGARVVACDAAEREAVSQKFVERDGLTLVHPYDDERIIAGQGTAARELFDDVGDLDALFAPVGGGGISSGGALAAAARGAGCRVIGVEPEGADDGRRSLESGAVVSLDAVPATIADGLRTRFIGERNLAVLTKYAEGIVVVSDDAIVEALRLLFERARVVAEPSGAVALAGLLSGRVALPENARVGVIVSGGNVTAERLAGLLG